MSTEVIADTRRWIAFHAVGIYRMLLDVHGGLEDAAGMRDSGQHEESALILRHALLKCVGIRSLRSTGELEIDYDDPFYDPFEGIAPEDFDEIRTGLARLCQPGDGESGDRESGEQIQQWLDGYVRGTEQELGYDTPPARIRTPEGLFPALRTAREFLAVSDQAQLPQVLPDSWVRLARGK